jgi:hypothetical protein
MIRHVKKCPECGSTRLTDNGGADSHSTGHGFGHIFKGIAHGNLVDVAAGAVTVAQRVMNPLRFTCHNGHTF